MSTTAPKQAESISTVTAPVKLPTLTSGRARFLGGVITGGVLLALNVGLLVWAVSLP